MQNISLPATCFPSSLMACCWDEEVGERIGETLGEEAASMNVDVLLGPGLNIKRNPQCGRNFECFSEDAYLSGKMAAAYVRGIQSKGVVSCVKHFAANDREYRRMTSESVIDERIFCELYLGGFEIKLGANQREKAATELIALREDIVKDGGMASSILCVIYGMPMLRM